MTEIRKTINDEVYRNMTYKDGTNYGWFHSEGIIGSPIFPMHSWHRVRECNKCKDPEILKKLKLEEVKSK